MLAACIAIAFAACSSVAFPSPSLPPFGEDKGAQGNKMQPNTPKSIQISRYFMQPASRAVPVPN